MSTALTWLIVDATTTGRALLQTNVSVRLVGQEVIAVFQSARRLVFTMAIAQIQIHALVREDGQGVIVQLLYVLNNATTEENVWRPIRASANNGKTSGGTVAFAVEFQYSKDLMAILNLLAGQVTIAQLPFASKQRDSEPTLIKTHSTLLM